MPLQTKLHGSHHLSEAFADHPLEFFIMLSSLSGTVGSKGQGNYAAGNTFQDALAHSRMNTKTHYMTLNLGIIEGTAVYQYDEGRKRMQNLSTQGFIPVKSEDLLAVLEYAISSQSRIDKCTQPVIGINPRSIEEADNVTPTAQSLMFTHLRSPYKKRTRDEIMHATKSLQESLSHAQSKAEIYGILTTAITQKLSSLVALGQNTISLDAPLSNFGLDSLITIDLKNWLSREFDAAIQPSEIFEELNVMTLAMKVASRSLLVQRNCYQIFEQKVLSETGRNHEDHVRALGMSAFSRVQKSKNLSGLLPRLPLPDLESTLELYLTSAEPFLSKDQFKQTSNAIGEFRDGLGRQLQQRLLHRVHDLEMDDWQYQLQLRAIYLNRRDPVYPSGIFFGDHVVTESQHTQAERAAIISAAAYDFMQQIIASEVEQDNINGEPLCTDSLNWLFNANREPHIGVDHVHKFPENNYIIALRRGHIFKLILAEEGNKIPHETLKCMFEAVIEMSKQMQSSITTLTADQRDSWAELRDALKSSDQSVDTVINVIEAASFVICLDEGSPNTSTERCNQFLFGDPSNRWSDKSLQFVICENGVSAFVCEHSTLDALSVKQLNKAVMEAITEHKSNIQLYSSTYDRGIAHKYFEELKIRRNPSIESHINRIQGEFRESHAMAELNHFYLPHLGKNWLRSHKIPPKTGCQLIIQLASLLHFGQQHPSWEFITMMVFYKGRGDWMQVVSPSMFAFCQAAVDESISPNEVRKLLREAAETHTSTMMRIARGKGFAAHLEVLREILQPDEPVPALFKDPTWEMMRVTSTRKIKTDSLEGLMVQEGGFLMPDPRSVLVHYEVESEGCKLFIQSTQGQTTAFYEAIKKAADKIKSLLDT